MIRIRFDRSEACIESHSHDGQPLTPDSRTIDFDSSDGSWVQLTYGSLRTQAGDIIAETGVTPFPCDCWWLDDEPYSDVVIEFLP